MSNNEPKPYNHEAKDAFEAIGIDKEEFIQNLKAVEEKIRERSGISEEGMGKTKVSIEVEEIEKGLSVREIAFLLVIMKTQLKEQEDKLRAIKELQDLYFKMNEEKLAMLGKVMDEVKDAFDPAKGKSGVDPGKDETQQEQPVVEQSK
jgi:NCAIR mutase (PurE)-related protein